MSDTPVTRPHAPAKGSEGLNTQTQTPARKPGHESPYVQPKTYLRPEIRSPPMEPRAMSVLDREQMQGLVCHTLPGLPLQDCLPSCLCAWAIVSTLMVVYREQANAEAGVHCKKKNTLTHGVLSRKQSGTSSKSAPAMMSCLYPSV